MNIRSFSYFLAYTGMASALIPFLVGIWKYKHKAHYLHLLCILSGISFICDLFGLTTHLNAGGNIYRILEFLILLRIFYLSADKPKDAPKYIIITGAFTIFSIANLIFYQQDKLNSLTNTISALVFIVFSVLYYYRLMRKWPDRKVPEYPMFWIAIATFGYFAGNLFLFMIYDHLVSTLKTVSDNDKLMVYWDFHNILNITKNVLFTIALWPRHQTTRSL